MLRQILWLNVFRVVCFVLVFCGGVLIAPLSASAETIEQVQAKAVGGDVQAQMALGMYFYSTHEEGKEPDFAQSALWYSKAAEQGNLDAQFIIGKMYYVGQGVKKDLTQAENWFSKAAEAGGLAAQYRLGQMFANGEGVAQDFAVAHAWYNLAALSGYETAKEARDELAKRMTTDQIRKAQKRVVDWQEAHAAKEAEAAAKKAKSEK